MRWLVALLLTVSLARADGEESGAFDYYVLSLSWSPTWCALEGDARDAEQCDAAHGWILHGLWPQYHRGYPAFCPTSAPPPARSETAGMADIMGSGGLAWHQWKKHGTCSGLAAGDYFRLARTSFVQPFDHAKLPLNVVAGWLVFGWVPPGRLWLGAAIIIASIAFITHWEAKKTKLVERKV